MTLLSIVFLSFGRLNKGQNFYRIVFSFFPTACFSLSFSLYLSFLLYDFAQLLLPCQNSASKLIPPITSRFSPFASVQNFSADDPVSHDFKKLGSNLSEFLSSTYEWMIIFFTCLYAAIIKKYFNYQQVKSLLHIVFIVKNLVLFNHLFQQFLLLQYLYIQLLIFQ